MRSRLQVPKSENYPEGVKYSFFATHFGKILVGYDNHRPKGHHRHFAGKQGPYDFGGFDKLRQDFATDLEATLREIKVTYGIENNSDKTEIG